MTEFKQDEEFTPVLFRIARSKRLAELDGVTAVFPTIPESETGVACYAHVGQHSECSMLWATGPTTRPATPEEYADLKAELEGAPYGYRLDVRQRYSKHLRDAGRAEWRRLQSRS